MSWHAPLLAEIRQEFTRLFSLPEFTSAQRAAVIALRQVLSHAKDLSFPLSPEHSQALWEHSTADRDLYTQAFSQLVEVLDTNSCYFSRLYGPYLREFIGEYLSCQAGATLSLPARIYRLHPDNPLTINADGSISGCEKASLKDFMQLQAYYASLQEAQRRGRPEKPYNHRPTTTQKSRSRMLDPAKAARAYQLFMGGHNWKAIAHEVLPPCNLGDPRQRNQAKSKVSRLIERGRLNAQSGRP